MARRVRVRVIRAELFRRAFLSAVAAVVVGCGGSPRPAVEPAAAPPPATAASPSAVPAGPDAEDPTESPDPIPMTVELNAPFDAGTFPKKTASDKTCWQTLSLSGDASKDYEKLAGSCGAPAGLVEYAKPVKGHLHSVKDKRDTFTLKLQKGLCYRYFAVADSGIKDLDILVEKRNGALVADDKQTSPVAIIESEKTWCMNEDAEYDFHIEVDGEGAGKYVFGVWARPK